MAVFLTDRDPDDDIVAAMKRVAAPPRPQQHPPVLQCNDCGAVMREEDAHEYDDEPGLCCRECYSSDLRRLV